jgi:hypothetical protein
VELESVIAICFTGRKAVRGKKHQGSMAAMLCRSIAHQGNAIRAGERKASTSNAEGKWNAVRRRGCYEENMGASTGKSSGLPHKNDEIDSAEKAAKAGIYAADRHCIPAVFARSKLLSATAGNAGIASAACAASGQ